MIDIDGEPWFPAKDVCDMLGIKNASQALNNNCDDDERMHVARSNLISNDISFPNRGMVCVNESGATALIFASRKKEARAFRKWVTSVVLPSIRKNGGYIKDQEKVATGETSEDELVATSALWGLGSTIKLSSTIEENQQASGATAPVRSLAGLFGWSVASASGSRVRGVIALAAT